MKALSSLLAAMIVASSVGCTTFDRIAHELQPHRLWRINRYSKPGREDARFYSVRDLEAEAALELDDQLLLTEPKDDDVNANRVCD